MQTIVEKILQTYQQQLTGTKTRYKAPFNTEECTHLLSRMYCAELAQRGVKPSLDVETTRKIKKVSTWLTTDRKCGLLLYGTVGSGKTTLAKAICNLIGTVHYSPLKELRKVVARTTSVEINNTVTNPERFSPNTFDGWKNKPMLFIDDLGIEEAEIKTYGNQTSPIKELLSHRYDKQLFTIITTNLDYEIIKANYGDRIADRFIEFFDTIGFKGKSYRQ